QTDAHPRTSSSFDSLLVKLRKAGKGRLVDELTWEINLARDAVDRFKQFDQRGGGHVIVGRVVGEGLVDASIVVAQMRIHPEGYFVGPVTGSHAPIGFRKQGFLPVEITPNGEPGSVEDVGEVRLEPVPEAMKSALKGKLLIRSPLRASMVTSALWTR